MKAFAGSGPANREAKMIGIYATLIGALQLARAVHGTPCRSASLPPVLMPHGAFPHVGKIRLSAAHGLAM